MATCTVRLNAGYGADSPQTRGNIRINRINRGDNGEMIVTVGGQEIPMTYEFPSVSLEQGVTYQFVEAWPGGIRRTCEIPASATADYSDLEDVTPVPPDTGLLGDSLVSGLIENAASETSAALTAKFVTAVISGDPADPDTTLYLDGVEL